MIWDFFDRGQRRSFYETAYGPLGLRDARYDGLQFVRMPVEADVEYLFVEGRLLRVEVDRRRRWMTRQLDAAIRAHRLQLHRPRALLERSTAS